MNLLYVDINVIIENDFEILKNAINEDTICIQSNAIYDDDIDSNVKYIGFVYHQTCFFPFTYNDENIKYNDTNFDPNFYEKYGFDESSMTFFKKYSKQNIIFDLITCNFSKRVYNYYLSFFQENNIHLRSSSNLTGNEYDWIMEFNTKTNEYIDIRNIYFNDNIKNCNIVLSAPVYFKIEKYTSNQTDNNSVELVTHEELDFGWTRYILTNYTRSKYQYGGIGKNKYYRYFWYKKTADNTPDIHRIIVYVKDNNIYHIDGGGSTTSVRLEVTNYTLFNARGRAFISVVVSQNNWSNRCRINNWKIVRDFASRRDTSETYYLNKSPFVLFYTGNVSTSSISELYIDNNTITLNPLRIQDDFYGICACVNNYSNTAATKIYTNIILSNNTLFINNYMKLQGSSIVVNSSFLVGSFQNFNNVNVTMNLKSNYVYLNDGSNYNYNNVKDEMNFFNENLKFSIQVKNHLFINSYIFDPSKFNTDHGYIYMRKYQYRNKLFNYQYTSSFNLLNNFSYYRSSYTDSSGYSMLNNSYINISGEFRPVIGNSIQSLPNNTWLYLNHNNNNDYDYVINDDIDYVILYFNYINYNIQTCPKIAFLVYKSYETYTIRTSSEIHFQLIYGIYNSYFDDSIDTFKPLQIILHNDNVSITISFQKGYHERMVGNNYIRRNINFNCKDSVNDFYVSVTTGSSVVPYLKIDDGIRNIIINNNYHYTARVNSNIIINYILKLEQSFQTYLDNKNIMYDNRTNFISDDIINTLEIDCESMNCVLTSDMLIYLFTLSSKSRLSGINSCSVYNNGYLSVNDANIVNYGRVFDIYFSNSIDFNYCSFLINATGEYKFNRINFRECNFHLQVNGVEFTNSYSYFRDQSTIEIDYNSNIFEQFSFSNTIINCNQNRNINVDNNGWKYINNCTINNGIIHELITHADNIYNNCIFNSVSNTQVLSNITCNTCIFGDSNDDPFTLNVNEIDLVSSSNHIFDNCTFRNVNINLNIITIPLNILYYVLHDCYVYDSNSIIKLSYINKYGENVDMASNGFYKNLYLNNNAKIIFASNCLFDIFNSNNIIKKNSDTDKILIYFINTIGKTNYSIPTDTNIVIHFGYESDICHINYNSNNDYLFKNVYSGELTLYNELKFINCTMVNNNFIENIPTINKITIKTMILSFPLIQSNKIKILDIYPYKLDMKIFKPEYTCNEITINIFINDTNIGTFLENHISFIKSTINVRSIDTNIIDLNTRIWSDITLDNSNLDLSYLNFDTNIFNNITLKNVSYLYINDNDINYKFYSNSIVSTSTDLIQISNCNIYYNIFDSNDSTNIKCDITLDNIILYNDVHILHNITFEGKITLSNLYLDTNIDSLIDNCEFNNEIKIENIHLNTWYINNVFNYCDFSHNILIIFCSNIKTLFNICTLNSTNTNINLTLNNNIFKKVMYKNTITNYTINDDSNDIDSNDDYALYGSDYDSNTFVNCVLNYKKNDSNYKIGNILFVNNTISNNTIININYHHHIIQLSRNNLYEDSTLNINNNYIDNIFDSNTDILNSCILNINRNTIENLNISLSNRSNINIDSNTIEYIGIFVNYNSNDIIIDSNNIKNIKIEMIENNENISISNNILYIDSNDFDIDIIENNSNVNILNNTINIPYQDVPLIKNITNEYDGKLCFNYNILNLNNVDVFKEINNYGNININSNIIHLTNSSNIINTLNNYGNIYIDSNSLIVDTIIPNKSIIIKKLQNDSNIYIRNNYIEINNAYDIHISLLGNGVNNSTIYIDSNNIDLYIYYSLQTWKNIYLSLIYFINYGNYIITNTEYNVYHNDKNLLTFKNDDVYDNNYIQIYKTNTKLKIKFNKTNFKNDIYIHHNHVCFVNNNNIIKFTGKIITNDILECDNIHFIMDDSNVFYSINDLILKNCNITYNGNTSLYFNSKLYLQSNKIYINNDIDYSLFNINSVIDVNIENNIIYINSTINDKVINYKSNINYINNFIYVNKIDQLNGTKIIDTNFKNDEFYLCLKGYINFYGPIINELKNNFELIDSNDDILELNLKKSYTWRKSEIEFIIGKFTNYILKGDGDDNEINCIHTNNFIKYIQNNNNKNFYIYINNLSLIFDSNYYIKANVFRNNTTSNSIIYYANNFVITKIYDSLQTNLLDDKHIHELVSTKNNFAVIYDIDRKLYIWPDNEGEWNTYNLIKNVSILKSNLDNFIIIYDDSNFEIVDITEITFTTMKDLIIFDHGVLFFYDEHKFINYGTITNTDIKNHFKILTDKYTTLYNSNFGYYFDSNNELYLVDSNNKNWNVREELNNDEISEINEIHYHNTFFYIIINNYTNIYKFNDNWSNKDWIDGDNNSKNVKKTIYHPYSTFTYCFYNDKLFNLYHHTNIDIYDINHLFILENDVILYTTNNSLIYIYNWTEDNYESVIILNETINNVVLSYDKICVLYNNNTVDIYKCTLLESTKFTKTDTINFNYIHDIGVMHNKYFFIIYGENKKIHILNDDYVYDIENIYTIINNRFLLYNDSNNIKCLDLYSDHIIKVVKTTNATFSIIGNNHQLKITGPNYTYYNELIKTFEGLYIYDITYLYENIIGIIYDDTRTFSIIKFNDGESKFDKLFNDDFNNVKKVIMSEHDTNCILILNKEQYYYTINISESQLDSNKVDSNDIIYDAEYNDEKLTLFTDSNYQFYSSVTGNFYNLDYSVKKWKSNEYTYFSDSNNNLYKFDGTTNPNLYKSNIIDFAVTKSSMVSYDNNDIYIDSNNSYFNKNEYINYSFLQTYMDIDVKKIHKIISNEKAYALIYGDNHLLYVWGDIKYGGDMNSIYRIKNEYIHDIYTNNVNTFIVIYGSKRSIYYWKNIQFNYLISNITNVKHIELIDQDNILVQYDNTYICIDITSDYNNNFNFNYDSNDSILRFDDVNNVFLNNNTIAVIYGTNNRLYLHGINDYEINLKINLINIDLIKTTLYEFFIKTIDNKYFIINTENSKIDIYEIPELIGTNINDICSTDKAFAIIYHDASSERIYVRGDSDYGGDSNRLSYLNNKIDVKYTDIKCISRHFIVTYIEGTDEQIYVWGGTIDTINTNFMTAINEDYNNYTILYDPNINFIIATHEEGDILTFPHDDNLNEYYKKSILNKFNIYDNYFSNGRNMIQVIDSKYKLNGVREISQYSTNVNVVINDYLCAIVYNTDSRISLYDIYNDVNFDTNFDDYLSNEVSILIYNKFETTSRIFLYGVFRDYIEINNFTDEVKIRKTDRAFALYNNFSIHLFGEKDWGGDSNDIVSILTPIQSNSFELYSTTDFFYIIYGDDSNFFAWGLNIDIDIFNHFTIQNVSESNIRIINKKCFVINDNNIYIINDKFYTKQQKSFGIYHIIGNNYTLTFNGNEYNNVYKYVETKNDTNKFAILYNDIDTNIVNEYNIYVTVTNCKLDMTNIELVNNIIIESNELTRNISFIQNYNITRCDFLNNTELNFKDYVFENVYINYFNFSNNVMENLENFSFFNNSYVDEIIFNSNDIDLTKIGIIVQGIICDNNCYIGEIKMNHNRFDSITLEKNVGYLFNRSITIINFVSTDNIIEHENYLENSYGLCGQFCMLPKTIKGFIIYTTTNEIQHYFMCDSNNTVKYDTNETYYCIDNTIFFYGNSNNHNKFVYGNYILEYNENIHSNNFIIRTDSNITIKGTCSVIITDENFISIKFDSNSTFQNIINSNDSNIEISFEDTKFIIDDTNVNIVNSNNNSVNFSRCMFIDSNVLNNYTSIFSLIYYNLVFDNCTFNIYSEIPNLNGSITNHNTIISNELNIENSNIYLYKQIDSNGGCGLFYQDTNKINMINIVECNINYYDTNSDGFFYLIGNNYDSNFITLDTNTYFNFNDDFYIFNRLTLMNKIEYENNIITIESDDTNIDIFDSYFYIKKNDITIKSDTNITLFKYIYNLFKFDTIVENFTIQDLHLSYCIDNYDNLFLFHNSYNSDLTLKIENSIFKSTDSNVSIRGFINLNESDIILKNCNFIINSNIHDSNGGIFYFDDNNDYNNITLINNKLHVYGIIKEYAGSIFGYNFFNNIVDYIDSNHFTIYIYNKILGSGIGSLNVKNIYPNGTRVYINSDKHLIAIITQYNQDTKKYTYKWEYDTNDINEEDEMNVHLVDDNMFIRNFIVKHIINHDVVDDKYINFPLLFDNEKYKINDTNTYYTLNNQVYFYGDINFKNVYDYEINTIDSNIEIKILEGIELNTNDNVEFKNCNYDIIINILDNTIIFSNNLFTINHVKKIEIKNFIGFVKSSHFKLLTIINSNYEDISLLNIEFPNIVNLDNNSLIVNESIERSQNYIYLLNCKITIQNMNNTFFIQNIDKVLFFNCEIIIFNMQNSSIIYDTNVQNVQIVYSNLKIYNCISSNKYIIGINIQNCLIMRTNINLLDDDTNFCLLVGCLTENSKYFITQSYINFNNNALINNIYNTELNVFKCYLLNTFIDNENSSQSAIYLINSYYNKDTTTINSFNDDFGDNININYNDYTYLDLDNIVIPFENKIITNLSLRIRDNVFGYADSKLNSSNKLILKTSIQFPFNNSGNLVNHILYYDTNNSSWSAINKLMF